MRRLAEVPVAVWARRRSRAQGRPPAGRSQVPDEEREDDDPERRGPSGGRSVARDLFDNFKDDLAIIVVGTAFALVRAMGTTIESGQTGLLFSFGRARRELHPGFHLLIPFVQRARRLPTRSRTMDLPAQRIATPTGLVYLADANLVYRIVDVRKALIEVDDVELGMRQMLGLGVQEVLRKASVDDLRNSARLDHALEDNLATRLEPWGVQVERAGFPSVTPSPRTLRITQLAETVGERRRQLARLAMGSGDLAAAPVPAALGLVGTRRMPRNRFVALRHYTWHRRRMIRLQRLLEARGWNGAQIKQAGLRLSDRVSYRRRVMPFVR